MRKFCNNVLTTALNVWRPHYDLVMMPHSYRRGPCKLIIHRVNKVLPFSKGGTRQLNEVEGKWEWRTAEEIGK